MPVDTRLSYSDLCALPEDGKRYEIIEGELFVTAAPRTAHQRAAGNLYYYLAEFVKKHGLGEVFIAPYDVVFSEYDVVEPEIFYISKVHSERVTDANLQGAPDLAVEVLSSATQSRDRKTKLRLYARFGVTEYWIVDPDRLTVEIYQPEQSLEPTSIFRASDALISSLLPGFTLLVAKLLE